MDIKSMQSFSVPLVASAVATRDERTNGKHQRLNQTPPVLSIDFAKVASAYPVGALFGKKLKED